MINKNRTIIKRSLTLSLLLLLLLTSCKTKPAQHFSNFGFESKPTEESNNYEESERYDYYIEVVGVTDGDTFDGLTQDKIEIRFRLAGVDAPEKKQPFANRSKKGLSDLIYGKRVGIKVQRKRDGFGRPIVWVFTPDGRDANAELLKQGLAWHYKEYDKSELYAELERAARKEKVGLWSDKEPIAPWDFRKAQRAK